jgi:hypothetical protein
MSNLASDYINNFGYPYQNNAQPEEIQVLKDEIANLKAEIDFLHERLGRELAEDRDRIAALEPKGRPKKENLDKIYQAIADILGKDKRTALRLKESIALDGRFVFLPSSHKQRLIVGLKEDL